MTVRLHWDLATRTPSVTMQAIYELEGKDRY